MRPTFGAAGALAARAIWAGAVVSREHVRDLSSRLVDGEEVRPYEHLVLGRIGTPIDRSRKDVSDREAQRREQLVQLREPHATHGRPQCELELDDPYSILR